MLLYLLHFDQINVALKSIIDFFQRHKEIL